MRIHYVGRTGDHEVFADTRDSEPVTFVVGDGTLLHGVEAAVPGMRPGEMRRVSIPSVLAYGERDPEALAKIPLANLPGDLDVASGDLLEIGTSAEGEPMMASVVRVAESHVIVDRNHPLAGKDLELEVTLVEIVEEA